MGRRGNSEGSIYQRKDGRWEAAISLGNGQRKRFYAKTRQEAARKLARAMHDQQLGLPPADDRTTVGRFLERWLQEVVRPSVRPSTLESYEGHVRLHIAPEIGRLTLAKLRPDHVQGLINCKLEAGLSPRTVLHVLVTLRSALKQAMAWNLIGRNVATLVRPPHCDEPDMEPFTPAELGVFLEATRRTRLEALYVLAVSSGLRMGEILGLRWPDLHLDEGYLEVRTALRRIKGQGKVLVEPKTAKSRSAVWLPAIAVEALRAHRARQVAERQAAGSLWRDSDHVFVTVEGGPIEPHRLYDDFQRVLRGAALPERPFHSLRHTTGTLLKLQGATDREIMEALRHSQISQAARYTRILPSLKRANAEAMDTYLRGVSGLNRTEPSDSAI